METRLLPPRWRQRFYRQLDPAAQSGNGLSLTNRVICAFIVLSSSVAIVETEDPLFLAYPEIFRTAEWVFTAVFGVEYVARVWTCVDNPRCGPGLKGRLRYFRSPAAIIDLLALLPVLFMLAGSEVLLLRLFRLTRILRLARLGRFSDAMERVWSAVASRRHELLVSLCGGFLLLVGSSTLLYLVEGGVQPQAFGSIPRAMWWAVVTLTTVGYGDIFPVTALGRILAAVTACTGIGLIAMPAGILAAAFNESFRRETASVAEPNINASRR